MAEFDDHETIEDALDEAARGKVKKASAGGESVEYYSLEELAEEERRRAGKTSAGKARFGLRMTRLVPPGAG